MRFPDIFRHTIEDPRSKAAGNLRLFSKLEIIFCVFLAENNFVNALIPFIGVRKIFDFMRSLFSSKIR